MVIGNSKYRQRQNRLDHSSNNASDLNFLLTKIGFNASLHIDLDRTMLNKIQNFASNINEGDLVLFYFCGHGGQVNGKNFMISVDDDGITTEKHVQDIGVNVKTALYHLLKQNHSNATILILDCSKPYFLKATEPANCKFRRSEFLKMMLIYMF